MIVFYLSHHSASHVQVTKNSQNLQKNTCLCNIGLASRHVSI
ncbi:hypothetical protein DESPIG_00565 [Desulfovibrio piger ATCC 29098]|uniref:Uncharacterized protein n=1 Tax=Desulfovibrio piger ATCC 29098 TaxID=411464 RepID=B6WR83_9BACT|nr:hypothetical protein DESPIG_00565 [Desulfovibrio piger ATCC 29098]